ncbi:MAG TPA: hypothetical protein PKV29_08750, partial [Trichococcus flocculiformis]|nr:hypothetical protein [Trichococcus flocculiformis]
GPDLKRIMQRLTDEDVSLDTVAAYLDRNEKAIEELTVHQKFMQLVPTCLKIKWILNNFF